MSIANSEQIFYDAGDSTEEIFQLSLRRHVDRRVDDVENQNISSALRDRRTEEMFRLVQDVDELATEEIFRTLAMDALLERSGEPRARLRPSSQGFDGREYRCTGFYSGYIGENRLTQNCICPNRDRPDRDESLDDSN